MAKYEIGAEVVWVGRARGRNAAHKGTVIAIVPAGESAKKFVPETAKKNAFIGTDVARKDRLLVEENGRYFTPNLPLKSEQ